MEAVVDLLAGQLSTEARVITAVLPAALIVAYFLLGLPAYLLRRRTNGSYRDAEIEGRGSSALLAMPLRLYFSWALKPVGWLLQRSGLPPNAITTLSWLLSLGAGIALAAGRFALGGWLILASGLCDFLDGRLARSQGISSPRGAALDSVIDRYSDAAVLVGLAWYYRDSWVLIAVLLALVGSVLISYVRARGEGLGQSIKVGLMQRPERVVVLGVSTAFAPVEAALVSPGDPRPMHWIAVGGIVLLAVGTQLTAARRFIALLKALQPASAVLLQPSRALFAALAASSVAATAADFGFMTGLVEVANAPAWLATAFGCLLGAGINFSVNRHWIFRSNDRTLPQFGRYGVVSATSALLNAGGVAVVLLLPSVDYRLAWLLVRGAVFLAWNLPLQRDYVYAPQQERESDAGAPVSQREPAPSLQ